MDAQHRRSLFIDALGIGPEWVLRHHVHAGTAKTEPARSIDACDAEEKEEEINVIPAPTFSDAIQPVLAKQLDGNTPLQKAWQQVDIPPKNDVIARMDWAQLEQTVAACQLCPLSQTRTQTVFGIGTQRAELLIIGEAPGEQEDKTGQPFVGPAGKLLDNMLRAIGLTRTQHVYIANVLKCRPPANRDPSPDEIAHCSAYLRRQVALIQPKVILLLGRFSAQTLLETTITIGKLRGQIHHYQDVPAVVTYHPAYLLRSPAEKAKAWADLNMVRTLLT